MCPNLPVEKRAQPNPNVLVLAQRKFGKIFQSLAHSALDSGSNVPSPELLHTNMDVSTILTKRGHRIPEKGITIKHQEGAFRGIPYPNRLTPEADSQEINDINTAVDLALAPGQKVIIVEDRAQMTLLSLLTGIKMIVNHSKSIDEFDLGTATGGTTVSLRMAWGLLPYLLNQTSPEMINKLLSLVNVKPEELVEVMEKLNKVATLDDYGWTPEALVKAEIEIGPIDKIPYTYRQEQLTLWLRRLLKNNTDERFISPPLGKQNLAEAANEFHEQLNSLTPLFQVWGMGCDGHGGFNEPGYDALSPDQHVKLAFITRMQNVNAFLKPDEKRPLSVFLEFAVENRIFDQETLKEKIRAMVEKLTDPPEALQHKAAEWKLLRDNFDENWEYMISMSDRVPQEAITQGIGDAISRSPFHLIVADGPRKSRSTQLALESDINNQTTASGLRLAPNAVWIIDKKAARYLKNNGDYFTLKLDPEVNSLCSDTSLMRQYIQRGLEEGTDTYTLAAELNEPLEVVEKQIRIIEQEKT